MLLLQHMIFMRRPLQLLGLSLICKSVNWKHIFVNWLIVPPVPVPLPPVPTVTTSVCVQYSSNWVKSKETICSVFLLLVRQPVQCVRACVTVLSLVYGHTNITTNNVRIHLFVHIGCSIVATTAVVAGDIVLVILPGTGRSCVPGQFSCCSYSPTVSCGTVKYFYWFTNNILQSDIFTEWLGLAASWQDSQCVWVWQWKQRWYYCVV